jgi:YVTN family beta-propeller protein
MVSVINPANNTVTATIPVSNPGGVAVSPTGPEAGDIYVTNIGPGTVSVINPATNTVVATLPAGTEPSLVAVSPSGPQAGDIYVTNAADNTVSVIS